MSLSIPPENVIIPEALGLFQEALVRNRLILVKVTLLFNPPRGNRKMIKLNVSIFILYYETSNDWCFN